MVVLSDQPSKSTVKSLRRQLLPLQTSAARRSYRATLCQFTIRGRLARLFLFVRLDREPENRDVGLASGLEGRFTRLHVGSLPNADD
jgi:hypothetical protein